MPHESRHLPLIEAPRSGFRHGNRSYAVCQWKCGNACDHAAPNTSGNETFAQVVDRVLARRTVLAGALAAGAALVIDNALARPAVGLVPSTTWVIGADFAPVAPNRVDDVVIPDGYDLDLVIRWGDPVLADGQLGSGATTTTTCASWSRHRSRDSWSATTSSPIRS